jgi:amino acid adenylation domain-containing protein
MSEANRSRDPADLRRAIADMPAGQRVLLEQRLLSALAATADATRIPRRAGTEPGPLSFAQERLWFIHQLAPESAAYNVANALRCTGPLDVEALRRTLDFIAQRHDTLRTTVTVIAGRPAQVVRPPGPVPLPLVDLSGLPEAERGARLERVIAEHAQRPFDLGADPMLRALLVRIAEREHVILFTMHHIASDGWSAGVLWREVTAGYAAFAAGRKPDLPPLPIRYADYAVWQRERFQDALDTQLVYWRRRLDGAVPTELPTDRPRLPTVNRPGGRRHRVLPGRLAEAVQELSRRERATPFMTLLAAFFALLQRYTGLDDVVIGSVTAGRTRAQTEPLIGFFVNALVMRGDCSGDPSFRGLLARTRAMALEAFANQDLPFERLVEDLRPQRGLARTPLFQMLFVLQDAARPLPTLPGLDVRAESIDPGFAQFDLTLSVRETAEGLHARIDYATDLFEASTIDRLLGHWETLLAGAVADPDRRLSTLPLLDEAERRRILVEWNATSGEFPGDRGLDELFEAQVARTPDAVAVTDGTRRMTYRELSRRAEVVASRLRGLGVGPDVLVAVSMERSTDWVVGVLGITKAGGAYLPLDPSYPAERRAFVLRDAGAVAVVTSRRAPRDGLGASLPVVEVGEETADAAPPAPGAAASGDHLAYVMYTSGSTGEPMGVAVPQRAVARLVIGTDYVTLGSGDVIAHASNVAFDAATFEVWGALLNGAELVVLSREQVLTPSVLTEALARHRVTTLFLTTSLFNETARVAPAAFRGAREVLFGGEAADPAAVRRVIEHGPPRRLLNAYGPTETTTFAAWHEIVSVPPDAITIPIGRPIRNTELYVLDRHRAPVPVGVTGELYIGGPGLARGYHHRPGPTAERFVAHPFSPDARLFRTGDRARYRADGTIEFVGRADRQVKIRGYRIEPGEVEVALGRHPDIRAAVVEVQEHPTTGRSLVAYMVTATGEAPPADDLRAFLGATLPGYMVPSAFVPLAALPLTPNGKLDRAALPAATATARKVPAEPRSVLEHQLVRIWEELLDVRPIGIRDDFFALGGHSLLAVRLIDSVAETCGRRLPITVLFEGATIEHLARALLQEESAIFRDRLTALHAAGARPPLFFVHGDFLGGGFYVRELARQLGPDQPFYAVHPHGLDGSPVPESIEAMAAAHLELVRSVRPDGPLVLAGHCNGGLVAFEMARQLRAQGAAVPLVILIDASGRNLGLLGTAVNRFGLLVGIPPRIRGGLQARVKDFERLSPARRLSRLLWRAGPVAVELMHLARAGQSPALAVTEQSPDDREQALLEAYRRATAVYVRRRYPGRVVLLAAEDRPQGPHDLGWRNLVGELEVHVVPGAHLSMLTGHTQAMAERLRACLERI